jgi:hypothetical protein
MLKKSTHRSSLNKLPVCDDVMETCTRLDSAQSLNMRFLIEIKCIQGQVMHG